MPMGGLPWGLENWEVAAVGTCSLAWAVVPLHDCQCHLGTVSRWDRIKLTDLTVDSATDTGWQTLMLFGIFLAPCGCLN